MKTFQAYKIYLKNTKGTQSGLKCLIVQIIERFEFINNLRKRKINIGT